VLNLRAYGLPATVVHAGPGCESGSHAKDRAREPARRPRVTGFFAAVLNTVRRSQALATSERAVEGGVRAE
jgi:hypothetical protein